VKDDVTPDFTYRGRPACRAGRRGPGNWNLRMKAVAEDGTLFQQRIVIRVRS
jgi:hypothetical protein